MAPAPGVKGPRRPPVSEDTMMPSLASISMLLPSYAPHCQPQSQARHNNAEFSLPMPRHVWC
eukprot:3475730-Rhodomonas_salina.4